MGKPLLTVRIEDRNPAHTRIRVYNRGGLAGTLVVNTSDAETVMARLLGSTGEIRFRDCRGEDEVAGDAGG